MAGLIVSACATPHVVQPVRVEDLSLTCSQVVHEMEEADAFRASADKERGATGTNVAAVLFFWPALLGTYSNINEAVAAADKRKIHLLTIYQQKNCIAQGGSANPLERKPAADPAGPAGSIDAPADINEVDSVPYVRDSGRDVYRKFLATRERPRAVAISEKGASAFRTGAGAVESAKKACEAFGNPCFTYAYNDEVLFRQYLRVAARSVPQRTAEAPQAGPSDPRVADVHAVPNLNEIGKDGYEKFLATKRRPRAFALNWRGGWAWLTGPDAESRSIAACQAHGSVCFTYVLDDRVVWDSTVRLPKEACDPARVDPRLCNIEAVPVRAEGKERYKAFLLITTRPRAFVVSDKGGWRLQSGPDSTQRALDLCAKELGKCQVYAEDDRVVWTSGSTPR
jgi:hypothetical protein